MTYRISCTSALAIGAAALVSLSTLSAARAELICRPCAYAKFYRACAPVKRADLRAHLNRDSAVTRRARANSSLGGSWPSTASGWPTTGGAA